MTGRADPESTAQYRAEDGSQETTAADRPADRDGVAGDDATGTAGPVDTVVTVEGLSKRFGSGPEATTAVDDVSLSIERGAIVGLLGPNGAGKTTLVKSILGMVLPDEGEVHIDGIDARERPRAAYSQVDALLEGARNDYWRLTVRENLRYFATVSGVDPDSVQARHDRLLERLDLADHADVAVRDLSRGMKQKVSLASVLAGGADVVFLDEPTLGLDVESARTLQTELRRLAADEGLTVVLSSHNMDVVETVCDRVVIMSDGRVIADDRVEALLGGSDTHEIHVTSADFDDDLLATLGDQFALATVERRDPGARIAVTVDSDGLYALMATLRAHDVTLNRVRTVEPDLEDVFVDITNGEGRR